MQREIGEAGGVAAKSPVEAARIEMVAAMHRSLSSEANLEVARPASSGTRAAKDGQRRLPDCERTALQVRGSRLRTACSVLLPRTPPVRGLEPLSTNVRDVSEARYHRSKGRAQGALARFRYIR
jgi:hypothetical protein